MRSEEGLAWLERLWSESGRRVLCAADFMERPRCLLEARRCQLYEEMPVIEKLKAEVQHEPRNV